MGGAAGKKSKGSGETLVAASKPAPSSHRASSKTDLLKYDISCFEVLRTVGTGSYSTVKLAIDKLSNEPVVLKIMSKSHIIKKGQVEHIKNERAILSRTRSPFIEQLKGTAAATHRRLAARSFTLKGSLETIDWQPSMDSRLQQTFQTPLSLYYVLEYVPGGELFKLLSDRSVLSVEQAVFYTAELVCGLRYLHSINTLFRDLKPENVLIAKEGHIKIADFGFAKTLRPGEKTLTLCGTPEYMAPEVIERSGHSFSVDWWQLGVLLYEMLFAYTPFCDPSPYQLYENILSKKLTFPTGDDVTKAFLTGLLQRNSANRLTEEQIVAHPFFASVDWKKAERRELRPPFVPRLTSPTDASNFDEYPNDSAAGTAVFVDVFPEF